MSGGTCALSRPVRPLSGPATPLSRDGGALPASHGKLSGPAHPMSRPQHRLFLPRATLTQPATAVSRPANALSRPTTGLSWPAGALIRLARHPSRLRGRWPNAHAGWFPHRGHVIGVHASRCGIHAHLSHLRAPLSPRCTRVTAVYAPRNGRHIERQGTHALEIGTHLAMAWARGLVIGSPHARSDPNGSSAAVPAAAIPSCVAETLPHASLLNECGVAKQHTELDPPTYTCANSQNQSICGFPGAAAASPGSRKQLWGCELSHRLQL